MKPAPKGKTPAPESLLKDADFTRVSELEKNFKFFKRINDPRFGDISIIQNPQSREFLAVREKKINDRAEAGRQILAARQRVQLKHPHLLELKDYSVAKQSELCSSFYILKLFYEYPRSDLRKEIQEKQRSGQPFTHAELTHLFYQQVGAQSFLQAHDQTHGDVQPLHVGWEREGQLSKLIDRYEEPGNAQKTKQLQKNRLIAGHNLYQSPTMYANLKKGNLNFNFDPAKEDAFALGLVLLEAGNGQSVQNIYDAQKGAVDPVVLQKHVEEFNKRFGADNALLTSSVGSLVTFDESSRPTARQVEGSIPSYDSVKSFLAEGQGQGQGGQQWASQTTGIHIAEKTTTQSTNIAQQANQNANVEQQKQAPAPTQEFNMFQYESQSGHNPYLIEAPQPAMLFKGAPETNVQSQPQQQSQSQSYAQPTYTSTISQPTQQSHYYYSSPDSQEQVVYQSTYHQPGTTVTQVRGSVNPQAQSQQTIQYYEGGLQQGQSFEQTPQKVEQSYSLPTESQTLTQGNWTPGRQVYAQPTTQYVSYAQQPPEGYFSSRTITAEPQVISYYNNQLIDQQTASAFRKSARALQSITYDSAQTPVYRAEYQVSAPAEPAKVITRSYRQLAPSNAYVTESISNQTPRTYYVQNAAPLSSYVQSEVRHEYRLGDSSVVEPHVIRESLNPVSLNASYQTLGQTPTTRVVQYAPTEVRRSYRVINSFPSSQNFSTGYDYSQSERKVIVQNGEAQAQGQGQRVIYGQGQGERVIYGQGQGERVIYGQGQNERVIYGQNQGERVIYGQNQGERVIYGQNQGERVVVEQTNRAFDSELQGLKMIGSYTDSSRATDQKNY